MLKAFARCQTAVARLQERERGATAVEYGLMVALIAGVVIAGVTLLGNNLNGLFNTMSGKV